jgi:hypothetical protein
MNVEVLLTVEYSECGQIHHIIGTSECSGTPCGEAKVQALAFITSSTFGSVVAPLAALVPTKSFLESFFRVPTRLLKGTERFKRSEKAKNETNVQQRSFCETDSLPWRDEQRRLSASFTFSTAFTIR